MRGWISLPIALFACAPAYDGPQPNPIAGGADAGVEDAMAMDTGAPPGSILLGGDRPAVLIAPRANDGTPRPLVILLHSYGSDAAWQDSYFSMSARVDEYGFFLLLPNGTREAGSGERFWNATDACCDFHGTNVDDVGYLRGLIEEATASHPIASVHLIGHSNGGFMAYRMACDAADAVDSVVSLAGVTFFDETACRPNEPTRVLQIHGTADDTVLYEGAAAGEMRYPGAQETVERWASRGGCNLSAMEPGPALDLEASVGGSETDVEIYAIGCMPAIEVELWRMNGAGHIPALAPGFAERILDWSLAP